MPLSCVSLSFSIEVFYGIFIRTLFSWKIINTVFIKRESKYEITPGVEVARSVKNFREIQNDGVLKYDSYSRDTNQAT